MKILFMLFLFSFSAASLAENFVFSSANVNMLYQSKLTEKQLGLTKEGFTEVIPSVDSRQIYVSSSAGSDANDCFTESFPCETLAAAFDKVREGFADHVYLKRGDVWRGENLRNKLVSGRSANEPAVLTFYGSTGPRPRIEHDDPLYTDTNYFLRNFHFIGLEFASYKHVVGSPEFTGSHNDSSSLFFLGGTENVLIEDNIFTHLELLFQAWDTQNDGTFDRTTNVTVRRNIFTGAYGESTCCQASQGASNLYISGVDGILLEENVIDYGGWNPNVAGAAANQFMHNVYIQTDTVGDRIVARNNIVTRGSALGIHGRPGGLYENNFFARNTIGMQVGYKGTPLLPGTKAYAFNNVISEGQSMTRGDRACEGTGMCTRAVWGLHIPNSVDIDQGDVQIKNNIVSKHGPVTASFDGNGINSLSIFNPNPGWYPNSNQVQIDPNDVLYENNIAYQWGNFYFPEQGAVNYPDPDRTLADYNAFLGGIRDFDTFMTVVRTRELQTWDENYTAEKINNYIRQGFFTDLIFENGFELLN